MKKADVVIIGGGPAGMAAAISAKKNGAKSVLIIERSDALGGILGQCIHNGFGLHRFNEELTGPEYAARFIKSVLEEDIEVLLSTMVLSLADKSVQAVNETDGIFNIECGAIVLAMGCRERSRGALNIAGTRPAGVFSAGTAQKFVNLMGLMVGKKVVILGSGDIGLIMARRMTLEGAEVKAVCELMPYSGGLTRNIVQCLNDFNIPLYLSTTVTEIHGKERVSGVTIANVKDGKPIEGTQRYIECDTLLLSVGLIPENELTKKAGINLDKVTSGAITNQYRQTNLISVFACGNVLHVHDLVDYVSEEAEIAGKYAAKFANNNIAKFDKIIALEKGENVRYIVPQNLSLPLEDDVMTYFRVGSVIEKAKIRVLSGEKVLIEKNVVKATPGEMLSVTLKADMMENVSEIKIEVVPAKRIVKEKK